MKIRLYNDSKHQDLMKYQCFWFTSAFLDASQKFSHSVGGKPEI